MTREYHTIINMPYEGCVIREHETKKEAKEQYVKDCKEVKEGSLLGCALVHIEVIEEEGYWRDE